MDDYLRAFMGAMRYEFSMQVRRWSVWVALLVISLVCFAGQRNPWNYGAQRPLATVISEWAIVVNAFMPVGFAILIADRLVRDRRLHVDEVLDTTAAPPGARLWGKYIGAALATSVPIFLVYLTGIAYVVAKWGDTRAFPLALAAFAIINLPGLLFVAAFSIVLPVVIWMPLYQFLFIGYWFWGNLLSPSYGIPTISGTPLTPLGGWSAAGIFNSPGSTFGRAITAWQGVMSIGLLLACAAFPIIAAQWYARWRVGKR
jgi:ABC-2 type transport system permease protein